jgi:hypothetical protein
MVGEGGAVFLILALLLGSPADRRIRWLVLGAVVLTATHLLLGASSLNPAIRYYIVDMIGIFLAGFVAFLLPKTFRPARIITVLLIVGVCILSRLVDFGIVGHRAGFEIMTGEFGVSDAGSGPPWTEPDRATRVFNALKSVIQNQVAAPKILIYPTLTDWPVSWALEPNGLKLIAIHEGWDADFKWPRWLTLDWDVSIKEFEKVDYFVVGPMESASPKLVSDIQKHGYRGSTKIQVKYEADQPAMTLLVIPTSRLQTPETRPE